MFLEEPYKCSVCIRECFIGDSFCHRRDQDGRLIEAGNFSHFCIDNLFDKPIIYFSKNLKTLSVGSWGCNLRCLGCQNAHLSWAQSCGAGKYELTPSDVIEMALKHECKGICYTFNEPGIMLELVIRTAMMAKEAGLANIFVTNSTMNRKSACCLSNYIDAVAADIKSMDDNFYNRYCGLEGVRNAAGKILGCIKTLKENGCHVEIRTNIIPGLNDQIDNYHGIASWIRDNMGCDTPWHITRFFPAHELSHLHRTPPGSMLKAQQIGLKEGLKHVHTFFSKGCDCAKDNNCCSN